MDLSYVTLQIIRHNKKTLIETSQFGGASTIQGELINIPYNGGNAVDGWTTAQTQSLSVSNDQVTFTFDVSSDAARDAWAIRLTV